MKSFIVKCGKPFYQERSGQEFKNKAKDGSYFWEKKIIIPDENSENEILAIQIDIQDLMEKNSKIGYDNKLKNIFRLLKNDK